MTCKDQKVQKKHESSSDDEDEPLLKSTATFLKVTCAVCFRCFRE